MIDSQEYISDQEARSVKDLFLTAWKMYKEKKEDVSDKQWLQTFLQTELPNISAEEAAVDAQEILDTIVVYDENLASITSASEKGVAKSTWLENHLQQASVGVAVSQYGDMLQSLDNILTYKNMELSDALKRSADGHIKMSPNLDGNIAEHMIASTAELSAFAQGKPIKVEVRDVFTSNSVDVRAINLDTGHYQNYQLKFGQDAKATIALIERGNYDNQRIVVPAEQLPEIQAYFNAKGSQKTITDHIDAFGCKGKSFTKADMKELQNKVQKDGLMPTMDYNNYNTKDLAMAVSKNTGVLVLQAAAVTTGLAIASKAFNGERIDGDELIETALSTSCDTGLKMVASGTMQVAVRRGLIRCIPSGTPAHVIVNTVCVGIENAKIAYKVAKGEISVQKGLDLMRCTTTSMIGGLLCSAQGFVIGASLAAWVPIIGPVLSVVTGLVGGMVGYAAGAKVGEMVCSAGTKIATAAKTIAKAMTHTIKKGMTTARTVVSKGRKIFRLA